MLFGHIWVTMVKLTTRTEGVLESHQHFNWFPCIDKALLYLDLAQVQITPQLFYCMLMKN